ncbi:MAG: carboxypeptidase M32 [Fimbriimonas sp.]
MTASDRLEALYRDVAALSAAQSLFGWDQMVLMPAGGAEARAAHMGVLKRMIHERMTSEEMLRALEDVEREEEPGSVQADAAAALRRDVDVLTKIPLELVERRARVTSEAYEVWKRARPDDDFARMAPYYAETFGIARETAEAIGYTDHIYDPLISLYEPGATYADAAAMFGAIREPIVGLVREIRERGRAIDDAPLRQGFGPESLRSFAQGAAGVIGFDFDRGRLDVCRNAFCSHLASADVRMTTRPSDHLKGIVSSSLHEMGHGLYEQGVPSEFDGTPLAGGVSLAVHESQSRLWENIVGRSLGFWRRFLPDLQAREPRLAGVTPEEMYAMLNKVQPEFIRVGADELTYNLHILVRFELEVEIVSGRLDIRNLPEAWNAKYEAYLGIRPPTDTVGCLQDVHWSKGSVGYFPTYAMGNLIGGQMWACLTSEIDDVETRMERGDFAPILEWLQDRVYRHGRRFAPRELVRRVTGSPMQAGPWLEYAQTKYRALYGLAEGSSS